MSLTEAEIRAMEETSERVVFNCGGCGVETVVHVGRDTFLTDRRCIKCRKDDRVRPPLPAAQKGRQGTHQGRRTGPNADQQRATKRAASARNRSRRGSPTRPPCRSYDECNHKKHSVAKGLRSR